MLQLPLYIIIKNNNNKTRKLMLCIYHTNNYVHIGIANYENMIRLTKLIGKNLQRKN